MNLLGECLSSKSRSLLKRHPLPGYQQGHCIFSAVGPLRAAAFIFLAVCGCWENRCQECGSWVFIPALREPLTSGCECQLSVAREGDLRRIDGDRQASAGRTQSPREKGWKEGDLHICSHPETSPGTSERGRFDQQQIQPCLWARLPGPRRYSPVSETIP